MDSRRTAIECYAALLRHQNLNVSYEKLLHEGMFDETLSIEDNLQRISEKYACAHACRKLSFGELQRLVRTLPALVKLDNGNWVLALRVEGEPESGAEVVYLIDPLSETSGPFSVTGEQFRAKWTGLVLQARRTYSRWSEDQPFGLTWFLPEIAKEKVLFGNIVVISVLLQFIALCVPIFFQIVIDKVLAHKTTSTLYVLLFGVLAAVAFESLFMFVRQKFTLTATNKIDIRVARKVFTKLLSLPVYFFEVNPAGVIAKHVQQIEKIRQFLTGRMFMTVLDAFSLLVFIPVMAFYSMKLLGVTIVCALLICFIMVVIIGPYREKLKRLYMAEGEKQSLLVETVHGVQTVKSLSLEPRQRGYWEEACARSIGASYEVGNIGALTRSLTNTVEKCIVIFVVAFGAFEIFSGNMSVGELVAFQMLSGRVVGPLVQLATLINEYQETLLSINMLAVIMNQKSEQTATVVGARKPIEGEISLEDVTFRYPQSGVATLRNVNMTVPAHSKVGIVGASGSGKTTLLRLILGLFQVQEGILRIDGIDAKEYDLLHLRQSISVVPQESFLFSGTIRENIIAAKPTATNDEVLAACKIAGAYSFIERLSQGLETKLEEDAVNLSGGQRQRIALARAIISGPRILILDEATSALDPESEMEIRNNLNTICRDRTTLIVSHRLSFVKDADMIYVLERGNIAQAGTHDELLAKPGAYRNLWNAQNW